MLRWAACAAWLFQGGVILDAVLRQGKWPSAPGGKPAMAVAVVGAFCIPVAWILLGYRKPGGVIALLLLLVPGAMLAFRYDRPAVVDRWKNRGFSPEARRAWPSTSAYLRELATAQEQFRLTHRVYTNDLAALDRWLPSRLGPELVLETRDSTGWSATVTKFGATCRIWVRDIRMQPYPWLPEGVPVCGRPGTAGMPKIGTTVIGEARPEVPFSASDIRGTWIQHRFDAERSGMTAGDGSRGYRWTARIGGEIVAPAAVAGGQVFVGAQGNGEFVALSLQTGQVGYRVRLPNWLHHEPAVTAELVIAAFGNNEMSPHGYKVLGSPPGGVIAFDRRTGVERWRRTTLGSVMTSPVVRDSVVAIVASSYEAFGLRLRDGSVLWHARLPHSSMGNPLLIDSMIVVGGEPTQLCALGIADGHRQFCHRIPGAAGAWGAGHASPAAAGATVFQTIDRGNAWASPAAWFEHFRWGLGLSRQTWAGVATTGEQVLVASDLHSGKEYWQRSLGKGTLQPVGHIAGTPTVADGVVFVPSPLNGRVTAVRAADGEVIWTRDIGAARGSVFVWRGAVIVVSTAPNYSVLEASSGKVICTQKLPGTSDRSGITAAGETGLLTLRNGLVLARPLSEWLSCRI